MKMMKMKKENKKADLHLNTIVVVVILLIVMAIIIVIFSKSSSNFVKGTRSCAEKGGSCSVGECLSGGCDCNDPAFRGSSASSSPNTDDLWTVISGTDCEKNKRICCKKIA